MDWGPDFFRDTNDDFKEIQCIWQKKLLLGINFFHLVRYYRYKAIIKGDE